MLAEQNEAGAGRLVQVAEMTLTSLHIPKKSNLKPRVLVFGVGGAGCNAVNNMIDQGLEGVDFVVANTDAQSLDNSKADRKVQLGAGTTDGLGAGSDPTIGLEAAKESLDAIKEELRDAHMCFITAGMGGGTGTGASPIIAQTSRELGILTVGVVTTPFAFEGPKRMDTAMKGAEELQRSVDTMITIPNQNLFRTANDNTLTTDSFMEADDVLYQGVKSTIELMTRPGLINLDFADVRTVMQIHGSAIMGCGEADGEERGKKAAMASMNNPLLNDTPLTRAKGVLINIIGGNDLKLFDIQSASTTIREKLDEDANVIVGTALDETLGDKVKVSLVATGLEFSEAANYQSQEEEVEESQSLAFEEAEQLLVAEAESEAEAAIVENLVSEPDPETSVPDIFDERTWPTYSDDGNASAPETSNPVSDADGDLPQGLDSDPRSTARRIRDLFVAPKPKKGQANGNVENPPTRGNLPPSDEPSGGPKDLRSNNLDRSFASHISRHPRTSPEDGGPRLTRPLGSLVRAQQEEFDATHRIPAFMRRQAS